jgi:serine/threonine-protein kinase HipA
MTAPLVVSVGGTRAGLLQPSREGSFFELDDEYLDLPDRPVLGQFFEDDPTRPQRTRQGVPSWFANLLPEGPLRQLIAERANVHERRSFFLLNLLGNDLPGAVTVQSLDEESLDQDEVKASEGDVEVPLRFSLAGVQLKFSAVREDRGLTIPAQGLGGDWIVKLPDQRFDGVPENEYSMMELARDSGLNVPETQLVDVSEIGGLPDEVADIAGCALAVRRFDRTDGGRVHIEDFAQVLGLSPIKKYGATNFDTIARVIAATCGEDDVDEYLRRLVFMVAIGNYDAHAKNWSLIYPDGRSAHLAPAYDLVAVSAYEAVERRLEQKLALKLAGVNAAEDVGEDTFRRLAKRAGLNEERTISVVRDEVQAILVAWQELQQKLSSEVRHQSLTAAIEDRLSRLQLFR